MYHIIEFGSLEQLLLLFLKSFHNKEPSSWSRSSFIVRSFEGKFVTYFFESVVEFLNKGEYLKHTLVFNNSIDDSGATSLSEALKTHPSLTELNMQEDY